MPVLVRASFGFLLRHPWQLLLTVLGIALGVGVMLAVDLANSSARTAFLLSMDALNGQSTHQIIGGPKGVSEGIYSDLKSAGLDARLAPVADAAAQFDGIVLSVLGVDPLAEREFRTYTTPYTLANDERAATADGDPDFLLLQRFLTEPGAALVAASTAEALGLSLGQAYSIVVAGREQTFFVLGIIADDAAQYQELLVVDVATVQEWLDEPGFLSRIDVRAHAEAAAEIRERLPAGAQLIPASFRTQAATDMTAAFMTNLSAMSLLALLVGVFLIYNSVGFAVVQRRRLIGVLRALGLSRAQAFGMIMFESLCLALVGVAAGTVIGIELGERLLQLVAQSINDLYFRVAVTDVTINAWSVAKAVAAGTLATAVAAAVPAYEAAGVRPSLSLARSVLERRSRHLLPRLSLIGCAGIGLAIGILAFSGASLLAGLIALFLLVVGSALIVPALVSVLTRVTAGPSARLGGVGARIAIDGIRSSLSRTGVAIVALAVAVSATIGVSVMVDSFRTAVSTWVAGTLQADLYVGVASGTLDSEIAADIARLDSVAEMSDSRRIWVEDAGGRTRLVALTMASRSYAGTELVDVDTELAWQSFDDQEGVLVSEPYAYRRAVARGDSVGLQTDVGHREFKIAGVYRSYEASQGVVLMSRRTYDQYWRDDSVDSVGVYLRQGMDAAAAVTAIRRLSEGRQALRIETKQALTDVSLRIFDRTFVITNVLYWLAVGVAIIGILGAMLALQLERARELATLRALGMTPGGLARLVIGQTAAIGVLSGLAAIPLGLMMAWVLIDVINRRSFGWNMAMSIEPRILLTSLALAIAAAVVAGAYPAYRAARRQPAAAIREE